MAPASPSDDVPRSAPRRFLAAVSLVFGFTLLSPLFLLALALLCQAMVFLRTWNPSALVVCRKYLSFGASLRLVWVAGIGLVAAGFALVGEGPRARRCRLDPARSLDRDDIAQRLARNVQTEPAAWDRVQNLLALLAEYRDHPATRKALGAAIEDESPEVRLQAAIALGEEGCGALLELGGGADDSCASRAIFALGERLPREGALPILWSALRRRRLNTARACLHTLGRPGDAEAVDALARVLSWEKGPLGTAAAAALGATGLAAAEGPLLAALERGLPEVRVSAAIALGRVGTAQAVLPLKAAEARHPDDDDLRRASRRAVAAVQSRTGAEPGRLSLMEGGQLSLAEDERGRLSLPQGDRCGPSARLTSDGPCDPPEPLSPVHAALLTRPAP